jgi:2-oxoisovalerate dehydrogenase E1 component subunit beta
VLREGNDITLVAWGAAIYETLKVADTLAEEGVYAEVIDAATLKPLDMDTILASVAKTGRCAIIQEAARTGGFGAEIAASLAEEGLLSLMAPVVRVTGYDTIVPLAKLENQWMPGTERILKGIRKVMDFG